MKYATFCMPHIGGTWTVAQNLHDGLKRYGVEVKWLGFNSRARKAYNDPVFKEAKKWGSIICETENECQQAKVIAKHLIENRYDGIFVDVLASRVVANLCRFLPRHIRRIMIVHSITVGTYAFARTIRDYIHHTIAISPRIADDLIRSKGFDSDRLSMIPHCVRRADGITFDNKAITSRRIKIASLGRIEQKSKNVFLLPEIISKCKTDVCLNIAGSGPDFEDLQIRCSGLTDRIGFIGRVVPEEVQGFLSKHDIFLMPSMFEGFGLTIIEAMSAGCVPIVSKLRGVTDSIVDDGKTGFVFPVGDSSRAAFLIDELAKDRSRLAEMSKVAKNTVAQRFSLDANSRGYFDVIVALEKRLPEIKEVKDFNRWGYPGGLKGGALRKFLPASLKTHLRYFREVRKQVVNE